MVLMDDMFFSRNCKLLTDEVSTCNSSGNHLLYQQLHIKGFLFYPSAKHKTMYFNDVYKSFINVS